MSKKAKKWKARYEDMHNSCLAAEIDLRAEQAKFYQAQHEGAVAQRQLAEANAEIDRLNDEQDAAFERGALSMTERINKLESEIGELDGLLSVAERERDERVSPGVHQGFVQELEAVRTQNAVYIQSLGEAEQEITRLNNELAAVREQLATEKHIKATWIDTTLAVTAERNALRAQLAEDGDEAYPGATTLLPTPTWHGVPDPRPQIAAEQREELKDALDAAMREADPRGPHEPGCTQNPFHTGQCHVPQAKSAIEYVKPDTDEGEGMLIAYVTAEELHAGDRVRFDGTGGRFLTVLEVGPVLHSAIDITIRISNKHDSTPFGDFTYTMEANAVIERNENP